MDWFHSINERINESLHAYKDCLLSKIFRQTITGAFDVRWDIWTEQNERKQKKERGVSTTTCIDSVSKQRVGNNNRSSYFCRRDAYSHGLKQSVLTFCCGEARWTRRNRAKEKTRGALWEWWLRSSDPYKTHECTNDNANDNTIHRQWINHPNGTILYESRRLFCGSEESVWTYEL